MNFLFFYHKNKLFQYQIKLIVTTTYEITLFSKNKNRTIAVCIYHDEKTQIFPWMTWAWCDELICDYQWINMLFFPFTNFLFHPYQPNHKVEGTRYPNHCHKYLFKSNINFTFHCNSVGDCCDGGVLLTGHQKKKIPNSFFYQLSRWYHLIYYALSLFCITVQF